MGYDDRDYVIQVESREGATSALRSLGEMGPQCPDDGRPPFAPPFLYACLGRINRLAHHLPMQPQRDPLRPDPVAEGYVRTVAIRVDELRAVTLIGGDGPVQAENVLNDVSFFVPLDRFECSVLEWVQMLLNIFHPKVMI